MRAQTLDPDKPKLVHQLRDTEQHRNLNFSKSQFPHLLNGGDNSTCYSGD